MDYSFSWFTDWMPTPKEYFTQIISYIPDTLDFMMIQLNRPVVIIFAILWTVLWFIFALLTIRK